MSEKAPILRLYPDFWTHISRLLVNSDIIRLMTIGCAELSDSVSAGMRSFSLEWHSAAYLDLELVSRLISRSPYTSLSIKTRGNRTLVWKPTSTDLWRPNLVQLELNFYGSIEHALAASRPLHTQLPLLTSLTLRDPNTVVRDVESAISFKNLPPALLKLHLTSASAYQLCAADLKSLPSSLKTLWLDVMTWIDDRATSDDALAPTTSTPRDRSLTLETFPPRLTVLALRGSGTRSWRIKQLPSQIVEFHLFGSLAEAGTAGHAFNLETLSTLQHLQTLNMPNTEFRDLQVIPRSVTSLSCWLGAMQFSDAQVPMHIRSAATDIRGIHCFVSRTIQPTSLTSLVYSIDPSHWQLFTFPSTLTELNAPTLYKGMLPESLTSLSIQSLGERFLVPGAHPWLLPPRLKVLRLSSDLGRWQRGKMRKIMRHLPASIESFEAPFCRPWLMFLLAQHQKGFLPALTTLKSSGSLPVSMLNFLPPTLTSFASRIHFGRRLVKHLPNLKLDRLRNSNLLTFTVTCEHSRRRSLIIFPVFLNHLPLKVRNLTLFGLPRLPYVVTWPPQLETLFYHTTDSFKSREAKELPLGLRAETFESDPSNVTSSFGPSPTKAHLLPPHMSFISVDFHFLDAYLGQQALRRRDKYEMNSTNLLTRSFEAAPSNAL